MIDLHGVPEPVEGWAIRWDAEAGMYVAEKVICGESFETRHTRLERLVEAVRDEDAQIARVMGRAQG